MIIPTKITYKTTTNTSFECQEAELFQGKGIGYLESQTSFFHLLTDMFNSANMYTSKL